MHSAAGRHAPFDFMRRTLLAVAGLLNLAMALLQLVLAFLGTDACRYFGAPRWALAILEEGGPKLWLLTLLAVGVSAVAGLYALSGAGLVRTLPAVRGALFVLGSVSVLWGLGVLKLVALDLQNPGSVMPRFFVIRGAPLLLGLVYLLGASIALGRQSRHVAGEAKPDNAANGSQPVRAEANRTSSAAGSRR
jgi:hypothetical protein